MAKTEVISEILSLYKKHGWHLRRVLLSEETLKNITDSVKSLFGDAEIVSSEVDAAWFSRASGKTKTAWELRHLSDSPFALFEMIDNETDAEAVREIQVEMEDKLKSRLTNSR